MKQMTKKEAEGIIHHTCISEDTCDHDLLEKAKSFLEGYSQGRSELSVCECHTYPTIEELHDYCVELEKREKQTEVLVEVLKETEIFVEDRAAIEHLNGEDNFYSMGLLQKIEKGLREYEEGK